jgi:hypothetical protein
MHSIHAHIYDLNKSKSVRELYLGNTSSRGKSAAYHKSLNTFPSFHERELNQLSGYQMMVISETRYVYYSNKLTNPKSHGENKLLFIEIMMRYALC